MTSLPDFDDLPPVEGMPKGCAWGLWDCDGKKDVHGTLNLLTPAVIREAYRELESGISVSLNWPINALHTPGFGRKGLSHHVIAFVDRPSPAHGYDDEVSFNTQCSSQWDSLCHFHHQPSASGYNGVRTSASELQASAHDPVLAQSLPTLNHWHSRGGLVARGVLIDARSWFAEQNRQLNLFTDDAITVADIEAIARAQKVTFRPGDVIIIRTGYTEALTGQSADEQARLMSSGKAVGVKGDVDTAKWFWNQHFAAVASDALAFEHVPTYYESDGTPKRTLPLHQHFLGLFGMSIGELWDLKELAETCKRLGRYSFLLTSAPLNYPGCIGSPPNALALF